MEKTIRTIPEHFTFAFEAMRKQFWHVDNPVNQSTPRVEIDRLNAEFTAKHQDLFMKFVDISNDKYELTRLENKESLTEDEVNRIVHLQNKIVEELK